MALELPNEMWLEILKLMTSVMDWGRLQKVSRAFNAIIRDECWVQVKILKFRDDAGDYDQACLLLEVNDQKLLLSDANLLLLLEELMRKATKITSISFDAVWSFSNDPFIGDVLKRLASASFKVEELAFLSEFYHCGTELSALLADFLLSISGTLKNLLFRSECAFESGYRPELLQAFCQCSALECIQMNIVANQQALVESVLFGASQLKVLTLRVPESMAGAACTALLNTGAHLTNCDLQSYVLEAYFKKIWTQNLAAIDHPLKSLQILTFSNTFWVPSPPFPLFPDLQQLKVFLQWVYHEEVNDLVSGFLCHYKDGSGEQLLLVEVMVIGGCSSLEEVAEKIEWPVSEAEEVEGIMELKFIRGNATARLVNKRQNSIRCLR